MFLSNEYYNDLILVDCKKDYQLIKVIELSKKVMSSCYLRSKNQVILGERGCIEVIDVETLTVVATILTRE